MTVPIALSILQPGATSPFLARFEQARTPNSARGPAAGISLVFRSPGARQQRGNPFFPVVQGDLDPGETHKPEATFRTGPRRGDGLARARSIAGRYDSRQRAQGRAAGGQHGAMDGRSARGASGISSSKSSRPSRQSMRASVAPLDSVLEPTWRVTSQGRGFVVGTIRNPGLDPVLPEVAIAIIVGGRLASLEILQSTAPLQPGETLGYGADRFLGLEAGLDTAEEVTLEVYLTGRLIAQGAPSAVPLPASIHQFEMIGSRGLFMQGTLTGSGPRTAQERHATCQPALDGRRDPNRTLAGSHSPAAGRECGVFHRRSDRRRGRPRHE